MDLGERQGPSARRHPWEAARAEVFLRLLARQRLLGRAGSWLDVGAGDAWFAGRLRRRLPSSAPVTCWDVNYRRDDLDRAPPGLTLVAERPEGRFDRLLMLDVVEHVAADEEFVSGLVDGSLAAGGYALVSVPAHPGLYGSHDRALRHVRRYRPRECRSMLERAGLALIAEGGLFASLLPLRLAQVALERARASSGTSTGIAGVGDWRGGPLLTRALTRALVADGRLSLTASGHGLLAPGLSYWALCRRREGEVPPGVESAGGTDGDSASE